MFAGLTVAMVTPFKGGALDEAGLRKLVDWHVEQGTDVICPVGTTGESPTLSHDEHHRVIDVVCEQARRRIKVVAGTGSNSTAEAIELTVAAQKSGANGALVVGPYYNKPTMEGFYQHFKAITEACDLPIILYNIPGRTAKNIEPETIARIGELSSVVAVKESTGSMDQASQILALSNLTLLSGDDSLTLPLLALGGRGSSRSSATSFRRTLKRCSPRGTKATLRPLKRGIANCSRSAEICSAFRLIRSR